APAGPCGPLHQQKGRPSDRAGRKSASFILIEASARNGFAPCLDRGSAAAANAAMAEAQNSATLDRAEVERFAKDAARWWDANGPFKPLHRITRERLTYIRDQLCQRFGRDKREAHRARPSDP